VSGAADAASPHFGPPRRKFRVVGALVRILRFLFWTLLLSWIVWLLRKLFFGSASTPRTDASRQMPARPLHRDPICGTYVSSEVSFTLNDHGEVHHFCSIECRDRFRSTMKRAAGES
jgi:YHS domain-containing protein